MAPKASISNAVVGRDAQQKGNAMDLSDYILTFSQCLSDNDREIEQWAKDQVIYIQNNTELLYGDISRAVGPWYRHTGPLAYLEALAEYVEQRTPFECVIPY